MEADYERIGALFDALGRDEARLSRLESQPNNARIRKLRLELINSMFGAGSWLVHLGCGCGIETVELARSGCRLWGIDISPALIARARERARNAGLPEERVRFEVLPASRVEELSAEIPDQRLTGALTSTRVLNLEPDLEGVKRGLSRLVRPSGRVMLFALNRRSAFARFYHLAHLQPAKARARLQEPATMTLSSIGEKGIPARYYDPQELADAFKPGFVVDRRFALTALTPGLDYGDVFERHQRPASWLSTIDNAIRENLYTVLHSDAFVLVMRRESDELAGRPHGPHWLAN